MDPNAQPPTYQPQQQYSPSRYAPPPPGYHAQPAPAPAPVKKRSGWVTCLIVALVLVVLSCACCCGGLFLAPRVFKTEPDDLGVRYSEADYWSALDKAGIELEGFDGAGTIASEDVVYSGSKPLDAVFTPAEVSALVSYSHWSGWPVRDAQIRFNGGNNVDVSGYATYQGTEYPFALNADAYVSGRILSGTANSAKVMGIQAPADLIAQGEPIAIDIINERLARVEGLDIQTAEVVDGGLHLVGTVPAKVSVGQ